MWCAGVVAIPSAKKEVVVETALSICDGMLDDEAEPIVIEQYALSIVMQESLELMSDRLDISVPFDNYDLDVKLATMRDKLSPGAEETWEVTVRDYKDKPLEAALLAGMYDASLDEFERNHWWFSMSPSGVSGRGFNSDGHGFTECII